MTANPRSTDLKRAIVGAVVAALGVAARSRSRAVLLALVAASALAVVAQAGRIPARSQPSATHAAAGLERTPDRIDRVTRESASPRIDVPLRPAIALPPPRAELARAAIVESSRRAKRRPAKRRRDRIENNCARNDPLCGLGSNRLR